ncbi:DDE superfamily endonuclease [Paenibacillus cellulosilyticus]|uniref:DDE superfamily endonuclease n=1 Tax=Paenibacillus cellulosilyticus TaxID=375489 RepID=A0A2V2YE69_9BACL|nr:transposase [Paenibacillus cellulosilyticus]PWV90585.1 DDE superfamily endonuclease [Paenibacillus cellulosilyticus]QKS46786.1 transposase [Paenibacillus cellulosilyticus]
MVHHRSLSDQSRFSSVFHTLKIGNLLRQAGIRKSFGLSALAVFQLLFSLVFEGKNWFRLLESSRAASLPGKDVVYRFLNHPRFAWRAFLHSLSLTVVKQFTVLTSAKRVKVFILDDSTLQRNRSKKAELLARVFDHTTGRFTKGYTLLTLGWSDGFSFAPIDFVMLSSSKLLNRLTEMTTTITKRCHGYKRRVEALTRKPDAALGMIGRALKAGFHADYVLMDSWFTQMPLIRGLAAEGLATIGMVKEMKQRYMYQGHRLTLSELYRTLPKNKQTSIWSSVIVHSSCGMPIKLVFVQNRNKRREWLAILSTDLNLEPNEIVRIYGMRWSIETFFKVTKSYLKLGTEFQGRSYDMLISHTTIVFSRYLVMEFERRQAGDTRTLGGLFFLYADEVRDLDYQSALQQLMTLFLNLAGATNKASKQNVLCQLQEWIADLLLYIRGLFGNLSCES